MTDKMHVRTEQLKDMSKYTLKRLQYIESRLTDWLADVRRFYPWPALEQSISKDIETVWQEQTRRRVERKST